jgi:putative peptide maturation system protein
MISMDARLQQAVLDGAQCLMAISAADLSPIQAQRYVCELRDRHPNVAMQLVWEKEAYDGSLHYDLLIKSDGVTFSVSHCSDGALPWPLRGVRRWSDADLAQINGRLLTMQEAVGFLDHVWNEPSITDRIIDVSLMMEELSEHPVTLNDEELQEGVDGFRRARKLYDSESTLRWMQEHGMTHEQVERLVAGNLMCARLRDRVTTADVETFFETHRADFDIAHIFRIECSDAKTALRVHAELVDAPDTRFWTVVHQQFLSEKAGYDAGFATIRRGDAADDLTSAIFDASPGHVLGPSAVAGRHTVARLLSLTPAQLDDSTKATIKKNLFDRWLAARRQKAQVMWFWGTAKGMR